MSLRVKCRHCGRELELDVAFIGAHCRCQYCRSLMSVPRSFAGKAPPTSSSPSRPTRPALANERALPRRNVSRAGPSRGARFSWSTLSGRLRIGAMIAGFAIMAGVTFYFGMTSRTRLTAQRWMPSDSTSEEVGDRAMDRSDDVKSTLLAVNPITHYFGIPLSGKTIGYIVDGDATMAPYIDDVAVLTNSVNESIEKGTRRFGVILALARDGTTFVETAEPSTELEGARSILTGRLASGRTDLGKALTAASNWYADEVFLVLSKPVDARQMEVLKQGAEQTGAVVHVIGLGGAAEQDLSPIAKATGGSYVPVTDDNLKKLVEKQNEVKSRA